jgi:hypothetical protein
MRKSKIDGKALRLANKAKATAKASGTKAKTAKGQRNAEVKAKRVSVEALAKRDYAEAIAWAKPMALDAWATANGFKVSGMRSLIEATKGNDNAEALEALRILDGFKRYTSSVFAREFEFANFDRLVRIEESSQRQGGINLGLAGYSPSDIIQLAVVRAWARSVGHALLATKAVPAGFAESIRKALSARSLNDFVEALEARDTARWNIEITKAGKVYVRKLDTSAKVAKVAKLADTFEALKGLGDTFGMGASFTMGEVQREVKRVKREGIKQVQNMLEGLTFDGMFTASVEASASEQRSYEFRSSVEANLGLITPSLESDFIESRFEVRDERSEFIEALKELDLVPAEADALTLVELLHAGESLDDVREVFDDLTDRQFAQVISASQDLKARLA